MKILTLPVAKEAFDMLCDTNLQTRKNEDYRAISDFWEPRLVRNLILYKGIWTFAPKPFDLVKFTNGYGNKVPRVFREWKSLEIKKPNSLWVPPGLFDLDKPYFAIQLGDIVLETLEFLKNLNKRES
jgi:hypothetical protein